MKWKAAKHRQLSSRSRRRCSEGSKKAIVLPVPVWACTASGNAAKLVAAE